jgi:hypothetical protein
MLFYLKIFLMDLKHSSFEFLNLLAFQYRRNLTYPPFQFKIRDKMIDFTVMKREIITSMIVNCREVQTRRIRYYLVFIPYFQKYVRKFCTFKSQQKNKQNLFARKASFLQISLSEAFSRKIYIFQGILLQLLDFLCVF